MNTNKNKLALVKRAKKTFVGRCVCRLFGDESGAVMMEYVIVAVMIAAAVAVGAWFFGKDIMNMFGVAGLGVTGRSGESISMQDNAVGDSKKSHENATAEWKARNDAQNSNDGNVTE